jgi:hypothetical protein
VVDAIVDDDFANAVVDAIIDNDFANAVVDPIIDDDFASVPLDFSAVFSPPTAVAASSSLSVVAAAYRCRRRLQKCMIATALLQTKLMSCHSVQSVQCKLVVT